MEKIYITVAGSPMLNEGINSIIESVKIKSAIEGMKNESKFKAIRPISDFVTIYEDMLKDSTWSTSGKKAIKSELCDLRAEIEKRDNQELYGEFMSIEGVMTWFLCEECIGKKTMDQGLKIFGSSIDKIFRIGICQRCAKHSPCCVEFFVHAAIQAKKIEWWNTTK